MKRVSDKLGRRFENASRQKGQAENDVRELRKQNRGPALSELEHERKLVQELRKVADERLELLDAGIDVLEGDLDAGEVQGPTFGKKDLDRVLRAFAGHRADARWFLAKCRGKISEWSHDVKEAVA